MMAKGRFLGFSVGEALMISAAAGALNTGPASFSDWGNPPASGGTGAPLLTSINADHFAADLVTLWQDGGTAYVLLAATTASDAADVKTQVTSAGGVARKIHVVYGPVAAVHLPTHGVTPGTYWLSVATERNGQMSALRTAQVTVANPGTVTINVDRTDLQCAPDVVNFGVDLSGAGFTTPGPIGAEIYDRRQHEIYVLWDFGDGAAEFERPAKILDHWRKRSAAMGHWVSHVYTAPNPAVTARATVYEPSSGLVRRGEVTMSVQDADVVYAGSQTVLINPVGDAAFDTATYAGAVTINADAVRNDTNWPAMADASNPRRYLFKRGGTYEKSVLINAAQAAGLMFGAYGSGAEPIITPAADGAQSGWTIWMLDSHGSPTAPADFRLADLFFQGGFDPVSQVLADGDAADGGPAIFLQRSCKSVVSGVTVDGYRGGAFNTRAHGDYSVQDGIHIHDSLITNFGGQYAVFQGPCDHVESFFAMSGTAMRQDPQTQDEDGIKAPVRYNHSAHTHMRSSEVFHTCLTHPSIKFLDTHRADGPNGSVHWLYLEGGQHGFEVGHNNALDGLTRSIAMNMVFDAMIIAGVHSTFYGGNFQSTGATVRSSLIIQPGTPRTANRFAAFLKADDSGSFSSEVADAPLKAYSNTLINWRDATTNQDSSPPDVFRDLTGGGFTAISTANNVEHQPNATAGGPVTGFAPLDATALAAPYSAGWKDSDDMIWQPAYASPPAEMITGKPVSGSAAVNGYSSGDVAWLDILGVPHAATPNLGAWSEVIPAP